MSTFLPWLVKVIFVVLALIYLAFSFLLYRKEKLMQRNVQSEWNEKLHWLSLFNLIAAAVLTLAIIVIAP